MCRKCRFVCVVRVLILSVTRTCVALGLALADLLLVRERVLGPKHPCLLVIRSDLACMTGMQGSGRCRDLFAGLRPARERVVGGASGHSGPPRRNTSQRPGMIFGTFSGGPHVSSAAPAAPSC